MAQGGKRTRLSDDLHDHYERDENGCWNWVHFKNPGGYGKFVRAGEQLAHRVYYKWARGAIPEGMMIDHMCMNRGCVNPDHLRAVTPRQNAIENSDSPMARLAKKQFCKRGHPLSGDNLFSGRRGRHCRECEKIRHAEAHKKHLSDPARYYRSLNCSTPQEAVDLVARRKNNRTA